MVNEKRWDFSDFDGALIDEMLTEGLSSDGGTVIAPTQEVGEATIVRMIEVLQGEPQLVASGPTALACSMLYVGIAIGREQERKS